MWKRMIHTISGFIERPFPEDELIASRFKVVEQIGAGSYGFCYLVIDQKNLEQKVLKTLRLHKRTESGLKSFEFEKKLLTSLKHQGFPRYFEDGIHNGIPFYTMEHMDGKNFEQLIFIEGKIYPEKEAFSIANQLLHLIGHLHDQQIVHRDVRIPNVIVADSTIRLIDFGLARKLNQLDVTKRKWKRDLRKEINPQADFYGLGHFLLFLLYSDFPIPADKKEKSWDEELSISSGAKHIIRRLLQIEPAYENCRQIETDILEIIQEESNQMSFFNKVFASVGIGAATVDTKLEKDTYMPDETVKGVVEVVGGKVEQQIDDIYLSLNTTYLRESDDRKYSVAACIERFRLTTPFTINANERKKIPFSFQLPLDTPVTIGGTKVWVSTGLDIKNGVDPSDKDYLKVVPSPLMTAVFNAIDNLGFRIREADCEEVPHRLRRRLPFVQEFEFVPTSGPFRGRLDELEVVFFPSGNGTMDIMLQVDRRAKGLAGLFSEALEMDETNVRLTVSNADIPSLQQKIESVIHRYS